MKKKPPASKSSASAKNTRRGPAGRGEPKRVSAGKRSGAKSAAKNGGGQRKRLDAAPAELESSAGQTLRYREARESAMAAIEAALDKKALLPVLLDVSGHASYTDFIAVVSGRSDRQVDAIAENVSATMRARGCHLIGREGTGNGRWSLLDFGDVIVHVFYHPVREFYDIESLWIDAPRVSIQVPPEAKLPQSDVLYDTL